MFCVADLTRSQSFDQGGEADDSLSPLDPRNPVIDSPTVLTPTTPDTVKSVSHEVSWYYVYHAVP